MDNPMTHPKQEIKSPSLRDIRDNNREMRNPLFADKPSQKEPMPAPAKEDPKQPRREPAEDPQPMTPPFRAPTDSDTRKKGEIRGG